MNNISNSYRQSSSGGGSKGAGSAAMSALTLLSFLFFLNILQQCLKDHMMTLNPQVTIMSAGREDPQLKTSTHIVKSDEHTLGEGVGRAYPSELNEDAMDVRAHEVRINELNIEQATSETK